MRFRGCYVLLMERVCGGWSMLVELESMGILSLVGPLAHFET